MNVINLLLCAVFVTAMILGAAAQASRFCLHGGLRDVFVSRQSGRLAAYFLAMAVAIVLVALLQLILGHVVEPVRPPQTSPNLVWGRYLVGGFLFGAGMMGVFKQTALKFHRIRKSAVFVSTDTFPSEHPIVEYSAF